MIKYEQLENKIKEEKDVVLVINFWSTTCAPCVKELPDFMEVNEKFNSNPKYKMLLVSLDRAKDKERVIEFIKKKNLTAEVVLLDDIKRMNTWIPRFEKNWDGNIPVTIFYKNGEKVHFNDGEMSKEELENTIVKNLN
ncbi:TlpA family protein disulfide reductase [Chryseobacterium aahli]|uniref:TlpA family protein disulfide reductase n=1 Tax=Chryseobacterium aahli TaxID=1278643 RepID=UPI001F6157ED|nr:TlpA disulfide reductase family protein [Chryseobacterium aahli]MCI3938772.1 TlpA family protein disulfide reductase [Chryseobacterium aahli]